MFFDKKLSKQELDNFKSGLNFSVFTNNSVYKTFGTENSKLVLEDIKKILKKYRENQISLEQLNLWSNAMTFSHHYYHEQKFQKEINEILESLEELDQYKEEDIYDIVNHIYEQLIALMFQEGRIES